MKRQILFCTFLLFLTSKAHSHTLGVYTDTQGLNPGTIVSSQNVITFYVVLTDNSLGARGVDFSAPIPSELQSSLIWIGDTSVFPNTVGNSQNGVIVDFGQCLTGPVHVLTFQALSAGVPNCVSYPVAPDPMSTSGAIQVWLCDQTVKTLPTGGPGYVAPSEPYVYDRYPPNGAGDVPLNATLSWNEFYCPQSIFWDCYSICEASVYFGTDPDPPLVGTGPFQFDPGTLQPGTTYYWKLYGGYGSGMQPVWSFTTTSKVPNQGNTWGAIKALYE